MPSPQRSIGSGNWIYDNDSGHVIGSTRPVPQGEGIPVKWSFHIFTIDIHAFASGELFETEADAWQAAKVLLDRKLTLANLIADTSIHGSHVVPISLFETKKISPTRTNLLKGGVFQGYVLRNPDDGMVGAGRWEVFILTTDHIIWFWDSIDYESESEALDAAALLLCRNKKWDEWLAEEMGQKKE